MTADISKIILAKNIKSMTIKLKNGKERTINDVLFVDKKDDKIYCIYCNLEPMVSVRISDLFDVIYNP